MSDCIEEAARYLATEPDAIAHALRHHRRRHDGRCAACGIQTGTWPCAVASSAPRAQALIGAVGAHLPIPATAAGVAAYADRT